jgi:hypothetical protein
MALVISPVYKIFSLFFLLLSQFHYPDRVDTLCTGSEFSLRAAPRMYSKKKSNVDRCSFISFVSIQYLVSVSCQWESARQLTLSVIECQLVYSSHHCKDHPPAAYHHFDDLALINQCGLVSFCSTSSRSEVSSSLQPFNLLLRRHPTFTECIVVKYYGIAICCR